MTAERSTTGEARVRVVFDMTFPDRNQGGSGVYARSLLAAFRGRPDVQVSEIRSFRPGVGRTAWWLARGAAARVRTLPADLVHCPNFVSPWSLPVPLVVTVFDLSTRRFPEDHPLEWRAYERLLLPKRLGSAARVIAISEVTRQDVIREYGVAPDRVVTVYPGVDERFFAAVPRRRAAGAPRLVFPGAPVARKNLGLVLRAMAGAGRASELAKATLEITGAAAGRFPDVVGIIDSLGLSKRVTWLGLLPLDELPGVLAAADAVVYPSLYEGFGFPPLEAMAAGTPVVASTASCLPEILDGAALLVDPGDVAAFSDAVESVLATPAVRRRLVEAGRRRASEFTWKRCAEKTLDVYRAAVNT
jgi:glycosyltransferase involved in cell wall biosynthesis